jgi:hypothetical protein
MQDQDGTGFTSMQAVVKPAQLVPVLNVRWKTPDDGQRNCPKHVEFHTRINLETSASVGFIVKKFIHNTLNNMFRPVFRPSSG